MSYLYFLVPAERFESYAEIEVRNHICAEWSHKLDVSEVKAGEIDWPAEYRRGARA